MTGRPASRRHASCHAVSKAPCRERCFCILIVDQMRGPNGLLFDCNRHRFSSPSSPPQGNPKNHPPPKVLWFGYARSGERFPGSPGQKDDAHSTKPTLVKIEIPLPILSAPIALSRTVAHRYARIDPMGAERLRLSGFDGDSSAVRSVSSLSHQRVRGLALSPAFCARTANSMPCWVLAIESKPAIFFRLNRLKMF
jgi:hypothetical protein